jgi:hypothetical protein
MNTCFILRKANQNPLHFSLTVETGLLTATFAFEVSENMEGAVNGETLSSALAGKFLKIGTLEYPIEKLRSRREFKGGTAWGALMRRGQPTELYNLWAHTHAQRMEPRFLPGFLEQQYNFNIFVPFADMDFTEMSYKVFLPTEDSLLISNIDFERVTVDENTDLSAWPTMPELVLSGPDTIQADGGASFTCSPFWMDEPTTRRMDVELEHVNGYLPKTRLKLDGPTAFTAYATGLEPGDEMKIKAGFRYWSSVAEKIVGVI